MAGLLRVKEYYRMLKVMSSICGWGPWLKVQGVRRSESGAKEPKEWSVQ